MRLFSFLLILTFSYACQPVAQSEAGASEHHHGHGHDANAHMNQSSFEELVGRFEDPSRDEWQKPDSVVALLGDLQGKTVMDLGCGTGYFAFRLLRAGARVICADVDERFLDFVASRREEEGIQDSLLQTRKVPFDGPALQPEEIDLFLIVDTYHHIEDRSAYFAKVKQGLKPGGRVVVVDFRKEETPVGPPVEMKLSPAEVEAELRAAGFGEFVLEEQLLPYQYILTAY